MSFIDRLPVLSGRRGVPCPKPKTRLELHIKQRPLTTVTEKTFRADVWKRDQSKCRCCGRTVLKTISRVPERGEVNHLHGRTGDLRYEVRAAALTCLSCHERFTGKVGGHRLIVVASRTFTTRQGTFTDATYPIAFERVA